MRVFEGDNPYAELSWEQKEDQLRELDAEWSDIVHRNAELSREMSVNQDHRAMLLRSMGVILLPVNEGAIL